MIKLSALFWLVLVAATGFAMFAVKYEVEALADELAQTVKQADDTGRDIRVLDAEWAYLNRPDALAQMNQRHLSLVPIATKQLTANLNDIPLRPTPPPPPPPPIQVASAVSETPPVANAPSNSPSAPQAAEAPPAGQKSSPVEPAQSRTPVETAALDAAAATHEPPRPVLIKAAARPSPPHRARSLNDLIAQIAESR